MKMKFTIFTLSCFALLCLTEAQSSYSRAQYSRANSNNNNNNNNNNAYLASPYDESGASRYRQAQPQSGSGSSSYGPSPKPYRNQNSADSYGTSSGSNTAKNAEEAAAEEEEKKPTRLEILLQQSKFSCSNRKNGYYSDSTVNCEVFHYCVDGAKHSWMCPENTVFHQVHLNCVPASLDICGETDKYSSQVNDYLHKPLDQRGPNNTVLYHQRYYPEEFLGDALLNNVPAIQHFGYAPGTEPQAPRAQPQPVSQPRAQPQARPVSRPNYATYDNSNDDDDDQPTYRPVQPQPVAQPRPVARPQPSYSPYQNIAAPKPQAQPINKPVAIAPAPQPYLANYRPVTSSLPRRPEYSSYQSSAPKPASYSSYPSSSSSASSSPLLSNIPVSLQNYKLTPTSYNSNSRAQPFKPTSSSPAASYPISYSPSSFDSSSSSRYNFGTSTGTTTPLRADGVTYEEEY